jgi:hypothetical protein
MARSRAGRVAEWRRAVSYARTNEFRFEGFFSGPAHDARLADHPQAPQLSALYHIVEAAESRRAKPSVFLRDQTPLIEAAFARC